MKNLTWSGVLVFAAVVIVGMYIVLTAPPPYRLVQPDGREAQRGRAAPRLDANELLKRGYTAQTTDLDWTSWRQWLSFSTAE